MPLCSPDACNPNKRLDRIKDKLIRDACSFRAVIGLQEVPRSWTGPLFTFFASQNYQFLSCGYGQDFNDNMGVAIAVPSDYYDIEDCEMVKLSDTYNSWPRPPPVNNSFPWNYINWSLSYFQSKSTSIDIFKLAKNRFNVAIFTRLKCKRSDNDKICFSNYHMPCMYKEPQVMVMHTSLLAKKGRSFAANDPLIILGDFNFQPDSSQYELMTTGTLSSFHADFPRQDKDEFTVDIPKPLKSAYAIFDKEPAFTNHALIMLPWEKDPNRDPFTGCLDYIFVDEDRFNVLDVISLPASVDDLDGVLPTVKEPSDHLLIGAALSLK